MNVYCLYFPNGKRYVGTEVEHGRRIADHRTMASLRRDRRGHQTVHLAVKKYGWVNIRWRYLATNCTNDVAWALEVFFIRSFRTQCREFGYNRSAGGEHGAVGVVRTEETKAKLRLASLGNVPWNKGLPCDGSTRAKIGAANRGRRAKPHHALFKAGGKPWNVGRPISEESKRKMIETKRRNRASQLIPL